MSLSICAESGPDTGGVVAAGCVEVSVFLFFFLFCPADALNEMLRIKIAASKHANPFPRTNPANFFFIRFLLQPESAGSIARRRKCRTKRSRAMCRNRAHWHLRSGQTS